MPRSTLSRPTTRYRPPEAPERYDPRTERAPERASSRSPEPRMGPYEFRYVVELGYPAPARNG